MDTFSTLVRRAAPDDVGPRFLILTSVLTALSFTSTALRFYARGIKRTLGWDDYFILAASLMTIARTGLQIESVRYGNGKHVGEVSTAQYEWVVMHGWYTQMLLFPTLCLIKCSICMLLLRIKHTKRTKWVLGAIMAGLVITNLEPIIILLASCRPIKTYWRPSEGTCWDPRIRIYSIYFQISYSALTDFICALMPMWVVYKIQMGKKDKLLLCGLMSLGLVATACGIVRASALGTTTTDLTYDYCVVAMWANSEIHLGIIGANAACLRHIVSAIRWGRKGPPGERNGSYPSHVRSKDAQMSYPTMSNRSQPRRNYADSTESDIPLRDAITKTTEYTVASIPSQNPATQREEATKYLKGSQRDRI